MFVAGGAHVDTGHLATKNGIKYHHISYTNVDWKHLNQNNHHSHRWYCSFAEDSGHLEMKTGITYDHIHNHWSELIGIFCMIHTYPMCQSCLVYSAGFLLTFIHAYTCDKRPSWLACSAWFCWHMSHTCAMCQSYLAYLVWFCQYLFITVPCSTAVWLILHESVDHTCPHVSELCGFFV
jgi:hypothetical protein